MIWQDGDKRFTERAPAVESNTRRSGQGFQGDIDPVNRELMLDEGIANAAGGTSGLALENGQSVVTIRA